MVATLSTSRRRRHRQNCPPRRRKGSRPPGSAGRRPGFVAAPTWLVKDRRQHQHAAAGGRCPRGRRPPDVICHTQTPAALRAQCHSSVSRARRMSRSARVLRFWPMCAAASLAYRRVARMWSGRGRSTAAPQAQHTEPVARASPTPPRSSLARSPVRRKPRCCARPARAAAYRCVGRRAQT